MTRTQSAIMVRDLSKVYKSYSKPSDLLREIFSRRPYHELRTALQNVNFDVERGECVGIIGSNGAGKSTLLKIIAGTLSPTMGFVQVRGRVSSILELGTGFHPEYSGRENVFLGAMCLGMTRREVEEKFDWIVSFSELGHVIDDPFKTYSSGMQARLTFATAISFDPEVLIIDEALAAGDAYFVVKCSRRIREICDSGATVLLVSHSSYQIASLCSRAIWIENGKVREIGDALDVCRRYDYAVHERISNGLGQTVSISTGLPEGADTAEQSDKALYEIPLEDDGSEDKGSIRVADVKERPSLQHGTKGMQPVAEGHQVLLEGLVAVHNEIFKKGPTKITKIEFVDARGKPVASLRTWDAVSLRVHYECDDPEAIEGSLGLSLAFNRKSDLISIAQFSTVNPVRDEDLRAYDRAPFRTRAGRSGILEAHFPHLELLAGEYLLSIGILPNTPGSAEFHEYHHMRYLLQIMRTGYPSGSIFHPLVEWKHRIVGT